MNRTAPGDGPVMATNGINKPDLQAVVDYLAGVQDRIEAAIGRLDPGAFCRDDWQHDNGGYGSTRVLEDGGVIEKGGVNFSRVRGESLPPAASALRAEISGQPFEAVGVSLVLHPRNPFAPTCHLNLRFFISCPDDRQPIWWFGGGFDLTPYYGFDEDCLHWHQTAKAACDAFGPHHYARFKRRCDDYFYLKHRREPRGIGGLFFDDYTEGGFVAAFDFVRSVGDHFLPAYLPILERRRHTAYQAAHTAFQHYRRGRYVEFNLLYDRGTLFGLQYGGRIESIFMSLPPEVSWRYNWQAGEQTDEQRLTEYYLKPRDWLGLENG